MVCKHREKYVFYGAIVGSDYHTTNHCPRKRGRFSVLDPATTVVVLHFTETHIHPSPIRSNMFPKRLPGTKQANTPEHTLPYTTGVLSQPPGAVFQARLLDNEDGAHTERHVFGKLSASCFQCPPFWRRHYSNRGDINHGKIGPGACDIYIYILYTPTIV